MLIMIIICSLLRSIKGVLILIQVPVILWIGSNLGILQHISAGVLITHLLNLFNENQGMREIGRIFVQFGLESIPECSSDRVLDFLLYAVMGKKCDWWNFHNHILHAYKNLRYWGDGCLLQHVMMCKIYHGIDNHVLFFKDLDYGIIIYHLLIFASHGFVFMHSAFFFPTKDFTFKFIIKLHTAHEVLTEGFNFLICSLFVNEYFITCLPIIWRLEAFQFKVCVDSDLVSQCHVFHSISCFHQLLKA